MRNHDEDRSIQERWALLRFTIIGPLLAAPPAIGDLQEELGKLAKRQWKHPRTGEMVSFGASTIERWYYVAKREQDPVGALRRKVRKDKGIQHMPEVQVSALKEQHKEHPTWAYKLHHDNLVVTAEVEQLLSLIHISEPTRPY